eukprot:jgi/Mesvir1/27773/Mv07456-RA.1
MDRLEVLRDEVPAWTEAEACEKWLKALGPKAAMIPQPRFGCHWELAQLCTEVHAFNRRQARGLPDLVELVRQEVAQAHKGNRVGGAQSGGGGSSGGRGGPSSRQFGSQADKPASAGGNNTASSSTGQATADPHKACWICGKPDHVKRACPAQCKKEHAAGTPAHAPAGCKYPVVTKTVQAHAAAMVAADSTPTEQAAEVSAAPASPSQPSGQAAGMEAYDAYTLVEQPDLFWAPHQPREMVRGGHPSFLHRSRQVQPAALPKGAGGKRRQPGAITPYPGFSAEAALGPRVVLHLAPGVGCQRELISRITPHCHRTPDVEFRTKLTAVQFASIEHLTADLGYITETTNKINIADLLRDIADGTASFETVLAEVDHLSQLLTIAALNEQAAQLREAHLERVNSVLQSQLGDNQLRVVQLQADVAEHMAAAHTLGETERQQRTQVEKLTEALTKALDDNKELQRQLAKAQARGTNCSSCKWTKQYNKTTELVARDLPTARDAAKKMIEEDETSVEALKVSTAMCMGAAIRKMKSTAATVNACRAKRGWKQLPLPMGTLLREHIGGENDQIPASAAYMALYLAPRSRQWRVRCAHRLSVTTWTWPRP